MSNRTGLALLCASIFPMANNENIMQIAYFISVYFRRMSLAGIDQLLFLSPALWHNRDTREGEHHEEQILG
jgi:hypothetical protein